MPDQAEVNRPSCHIRRTAADPEQRLAPRYVTLSRAVISDGKTAFGNGERRKAEKAEICVKFSA